MPMMRRRMIRVETTITIYDVEGVGSRLLMSHTEVEEKKDGGTLKSLMDVTPGLIVDVSERTMEAVRAFSKTEQKRGH